MDSQVSSDAGQRSCLGRLRFPIRVRLVASQPISVRELVLGPVASGCSRPNDHPGMDAPTTELRRCRERSLVDPACRYR